MVARAVYREIPGHAIGARMTKRYGYGWLLPDLLLGLATLVVPAVLLVLAYASPPDPSWIPGVYDDADGDDVVVQVMSATGNIADDLPFDVRPAALETDDVPLLHNDVFVSLSPFPSPPRAPPGL